MTDNIEKEIEAIKTILTTLSPLDEETRKNVVEYVLKKLGVPLVNQNKAAPLVSIENKQTQVLQVEETDIHIKHFKDQKMPKSGIEMATLVAYYLQNLAAPESRKNKVGVDDLDTWFKIADFPLPSGDLRYALNNARNAGYLDPVGNGEYSINAVGYNLIKHNLPRKDATGALKKPKKALKKAKKSK